MKSIKKLISLVFFFSIIFSQFSFAAGSQPNQIDYALYSLADVRDDVACNMSVDTQAKLVFPDSISNPSAICPDAYSWKIFLEAIQSEFWQNWSYDSFLWPPNPLPLCKAGEKNTNCCQPGADDNPGYDDPVNPGKHCPYYPGDFSSKDEVNVFVKRSFGPNRHSLSTTGHSSSITKTDPGRTMRQEVAEVVYNNKPMKEYVFANNFYNTQGLAAAFNAAQTALTNDAPYHTIKQDGIKTRIQFPYGSAMFKTDWLLEEDAHKLGMFNTPEAPFITRYIESPVGDGTATGNKFKAGMYYLVAVTVGAKYLPNWIWFAIEHVNNPGRCDYTGCNDSFGYTTSDKVGTNMANNFIKPKQQNDGLVDSSMIFDTGKVYKSGTITPALSEIYKKLGIGQKDDNNPKVVSVNDKGWMSYRLKGSQIDFTDEAGRPTLLGNSVTEGGFVNTSSCLTCHVRAAVNEKGVSSTNAAGFMNKLNIIGYNTSPNGVPDPNWFYTEDEPTAIEGLQFDYVWGILFAQPLK